MSQYNPWNGKRLKTIMLTGKPKGYGKGMMEFKLGRTVLIGKTFGTLKAYGFVGKAFQVTIEQ